MTFHVANEAEQPLLVSFQIFLQKFMQIEAVAVQCNDRICCPDGRTFIIKKKEQSNCESRKLSSCFLCSSIDTQSSLEFDVEGARTVLGIVQFHTRDCTNVQTYGRRTYVQVQVPFLCSKQALAISYHVNDISNL